MIKNMKNINNSDIKISQTFIIYMGICPFYIKTVGKGLPLHFAVTNAKPSNFASTEHQRCKQ